MTAGCRNFQASQTGVKRLIRSALLWGALLIVSPIVASAQVDNGAAEDSTTTAPLAFPWTERTLADLSIREKVGQLLMVQVPGGFTPHGSDADVRILDAIQRHRIGGVIVTSGTPVEAAVMLNRLQMRSDLPLIVGADLETGAGFRFDGVVRVPGNVDLGGATTLPSLMAIAATGEPQYAYQAGLITGKEARAIGVHMPFAPVLDVNNNPRNPVINVRSFGEDPEQVALLGALFTRGIQEAGAIATGKHFPGHGDTGTDSHLALPVIRAERDRLDEVELRPFREAIEEGVGAIMSAHISVPALTGDAQTPSTLSPRVLTNLLRDELGFEGLIVTDAMNMAGVTRRIGRGESAVRALEAGADIILMPPDLNVAMSAMVEAVQSGRVSEERLDDSVRRILQLKETLRLNEQRTVPVEHLHEVVSIPDHLSVADEIAERSITLLRNEGPVLPLRGSRGADVLSVTYRRESDIQAGNAFDREVRRTYPRARGVDLWRNSSSAIYPGLTQRASRADLVIISVYVQTIQASAQVSVSEDFAKFVSDVHASGRPYVIISFGSPYLLLEFPRTRAYMVAWSGSQASQRAAAKALFAHITISGRAPTGIPPLFDLGAGITIGRRSR